MSNKTYWRILYLTHTHALDLFTYNFKDKPLTSVASKQYDLFQKHIIARHIIDIK